jgi:hypothetical protein
MPYDPEQVARQQAEQRASERESAARAKGATKSPLSSSGGGGWTGAPKREPPRPNVDPWKPSAPVTADDLGGAKDTGQPAKSYGINSGDQDAPQKYLGHFANDSVAAAGHNAGKKPLGKATDTSKGVAKRGFRKLPGSASGIQGSARYGQPDGTALGLRPSRPDRERHEKFEKDMAKTSSSHALPVMFGDPAPVAISDVKMSRRHHLDAAARDLKHELEHRASRKKHLAAAKVRSKQLSKRR